MASQLFRGKTLRWLIAISVFSLVSALFGAIFGHEITGRDSFRADGHSRSAIGHEAFVQMLRELGMPVIVSHWNSGGKAGDDALLILAEPRLTEDRFRDPQALRRVLQEATRILLVLPKWRGYEHPGHAGWVQDMGLVNEAEIEDLLNEFGLRTGEIEVVRETVDDWHGEIGPRPTFAGEVQTIRRTTKFRPILASGDRVLFGTIPWRGGEIYVLTDPDVINTHSLLRDDNAGFAVSIVDWARRDRPTIVVDEAFHGFGTQPSVYRALFDFPIVVATVQVLLTLIVLLWASATRFGAPRPVRPPLEPGKRFLIDNIASLLRFGGHGKHTLARYLAEARRGVAQRVHMPAGLEANAARAWLDAVGRERGVKRSLHRLELEVKAVGPDSARWMAVARRIYRWKEEMIHGPVRSS